MYFIKMLSKMAVFAEILGSKVGGNLGYSGKLFEKSFLSLDRSQKSSHLSFREVSLPIRTSLWLVKYAV